MEAEEDVYWFFNFVFDLHFIYLPWIIDLVFFLSEHKVTVSFFGLVIRFKISWIFKIFAWNNNLLLYYLFKKQNWNVTNNKLLLVVDADNYCTSS